MRLIYFEKFIFTKL